MNIFPYKAGSASAKALAEALGVKRVKEKGSKFKGAAHKLIVNWGCSKLPAELLKCRILNSPESVSKASCKLASFKAMQEAGVSIPAFTEDKLEVRAAIHEGKTFVARTILRGHSGAGIVVIEPGQDVVAAPLYVEYIPKKEEYRIHVFNGEVVDIQRKARKKDVPDDQVNWKVRNLANGFIFARNEDAVGEVPQDVLDQAVKAVAALGLDFGASDVIYNEKQKKAYVLEVNTAPGLSGSTLDGYVNRLKEMK